MTTHAIICCNGGHVGLGAALESIWRYSPNTPAHVVPICGPRVESFDKIYRHESPNDIKFEMSCFARWFVLRDFVNLNNIQSFWALDWDVLTCCDLDAEAKTAAQMRVPSCVIWYCQDRSLLDAWCNEIVTLMGDGDHRRALHQKYGACSDMTLQIESLKPGEPSLFSFSGGKIFDCNIALSNGGFTMRGGMKALAWKDGFPYGDVSGTPVRLLALHFWGPHKRLMWDCLNKAKEQRY